MGKQGHLDPYPSLNLYLSPWSVSLSGYSGNMLTNLEKNSEMQHAYSGTRGTDTALSTLVNMIESSILRKQICLVLSVDIQGIVTITGVFRL